MTAGIWVTSNQHRHKSSEYCSFVSGIQQTNHVLFTRRPNSVLYLLSFYVTRLTRMSSVAGLSTCQGIVCKPISCEINALCITQQQRSTPRYLPGRGQSRALTRQKRSTQRCLLRGQPRAPLTAFIAIRFINLG